MKKQYPNTLEKLLSIRNELHSERGSIQVVGRALTPEEIKRIEILGEAIQHIDAAIAVLQSEDERPEPVLIGTLKDGLYKASHAQYSADLRIDMEDKQIISMDIFFGSDENRHYVASLRSNPGAILSKTEKIFEVICEDKDGKTTRGELTFTPSTDDQTTIKLILEDHLYELPSNSPILMAAQWYASYFREIGIEKEVEENIEGVPSYDFEGSTITLDSCFENAGIKLVSAGERDNIPTTTRGWDDSQLHALMTQFADESMDQKDWLLHLLLLSRSQSSGLLGVMFDTGNADVNNLPRQGVAVFLDAIAGHPAGTERKSIQTTVHELGHALNLAHRFEREVGRADSTSFMNYDWRYMGGNQSNKYWENFRFLFDSDEIQFLRHAPWNKIIPGGAEFHTIKYWYEGTGGYSPYAPEVPLTDLELQLTPPSSGLLFGFGTPVFLTVTLFNRSTDFFDIPSIFLDPKSGFLEILIKKQPGSGEGTGMTRFRPVISRCYDITEFSKDVLQPGQSMSNNLNLTFGSSGFSFAEPGNYEVTAVLSIYQDNYNYIVKSDPLFIRIEYPKTRDEELDALDIFTPDVGYYFALGGSDVLTDAEKKLESIKQKRQGKEKDIRDPLVAYIARCQAINNSREFILYKDKKFRKRKPRTAKAIDLFGQLKTHQKNIFDSETFNGTMEFAKKLEKGE